MHGFTELHHQNQVGQTDIFSNAFAVCHEARGPVAPYLNPGRCGDITEGAVEHGCRGQHWKAASHIMDAGAQFQYAVFLMKQPVFRNRRMAS